MSDMYDEDEFFNMTPEPTITAEHRTAYEELLKECAKYGYKSGWVYYQMKDMFGEEIAKTVCKFNDEYEEWNT